MPVVTVMTDDDAMYRKAELSLRGSGLEVRRIPQLRVECPQYDAVGKKRQEPLRQQMIDFFAGLIMATL